MLFGKSHINRPIRLNSGSRIAKRRRAVSRACRHILEPLEVRVLLSGSFPTVIDPTANQQNTSISVTPGAQVYLYGEATGGAHANSPLANGTGQSVTDTNGNLSADLAVTNQSSNSFTTSCNYYTMIGVGVSGYTNMQALYGQNVISGPGEVNSGTYQASVSFTLSQSALVVAMGLGSSQQSLSFQGPSGLVTDYAASNATVAGGIAHADLGPGSYTITETTSVTAVGQTLDNMADLLGVYIFTGSASTVVPSAAITTPSGTQSGNVTINYTLTDANSDPCSILAQYSPDGGTTWDAATLGSGGDATTGLTSSPSGTSHSFVWASGTDLGNVLNSKVEFRITPSSSSGTGSNATSGIFTVNNSATTVNVTVKGGQGPWQYVKGGLNTTYQYGISDGSAPQIISSSEGFNFTSGNVLSIQYESGLVSIGAGWPNTDANGDQSFVVNNNTTNPSGLYPSYYFNSSDYPAYGGELVGTFANSSGQIVGTPFNIGDSRQVTIPTGASQLQLGVNDNRLSDNTGSWQIQVSEQAATAAVPTITSVTAQPNGNNWSFTIQGTNLGTHSSYSSDSAYLNLVDSTRGFSVGYTGDPITTDLTSWTNTSIQVAGLAGSYGHGNNVIQPGDQMSLVVLNPQTGQESAIYYFTASALANPNLSPPSISAPATATAYENGSLTFCTANDNAITAADPQAAGSNERLTITSSGGTFTLPSTTGLTVASGASGVSETVTGTLSDLNTDLNGLVFTPTPNTTGTGSLDFTLTNLAYTTSTGQLTGSETVTIDVVNGPSPYGINAPSTVVVNENGSFTFSGIDAITIMDPGVGSSILQLTVTATDGTFSTVSGGVQSVTNKTFQGTLADLNADLNNLVFTPSPNTTGYNDNGPAILTLTAGLKGFSPPTLGSTTINVDVGLTPLQVQTAYGFSQVYKLGYTGNGQTIGIIDPLNNPDIYSDVNIFDRYFYGPNTTLASSFLTVVNESGQPIDPGALNSASNPVPTDGSLNEQTEEALDVEWAHAIAPGAHIVLIEINGSTVANDEFSWNDVATAAQNVQTVLNGQLKLGISVVSMSLGGGEFSSENGDDLSFAASGITFIASSGDTYGDVEYPSASPNVLSVGGTVLTVNSSGNYQSEKVWSNGVQILPYVPLYIPVEGTSQGTGYGASNPATGNEPLPAYQKGVTGLASTTNRNTPDVASDAVGLLTYSTALGGWVSDWGGTSYAAPQWAGLIALADQARPASESFTSDANGTYDIQSALYAAPVSDFTEPTMSLSYNLLHIGDRYNTYAGLGSPIAGSLVPYLKNYTGSTTTTTTTTTANEVLAAAVAEPSPSAVSNGQISDNAFANSLAGDFGGTGISGVNSILDANDSFDLGPFAGLVSLRNKASPCLLE